MTSRSVPTGRMPLVRFVVMDTFVYHGTVSSGLEPLDQPGSMA